MKRLIFKKILLISQILTQMSKGDMHAYFMHEKLFHFVRKMVLCIHSQSSQSKYSVSISTQKEVWKKLKPFTHASSEFYTTQTITAQTVQLYRIDFITNTNRLTEIEHQHAKRYGAVTHTPSMLMQQSHSNHTHTLNVLLFQQVFSHFLTYFYYFIYF